VQIILKQTIKRKKNLYHPIDFVSWCQHFWGELVLAE
jgi:hypothetical protein